jgi:hypothetical protein
MRQPLPSASPPPTSAPQQLPSAGARFPLGFFSAAADVVRFRDKRGQVVSGIVFANGSDWAPQPLTMYALEASGGSLREPWWVSSEAGYHTGICVGELDGRPGEDIAVTLQKDVYGDLTRGAVLAYHGVGTLERKREAFRPPRVIGSGFSASGCAIADLDQDGISEVLVGGTGPNAIGRLFRRAARRAGGDAAYEEVLTFGAQNAPACSNDSSALEPSAVALSDLNDDAIPDIVLAGRRLAIFYGAASGSLEQRYAAEADWCSEEMLGFAPRVDVEHLPQPRRTLVVVSQSCDRVAGCPEKTHWHVYEPATSHKPIITRAPPDAAIAGPAKLLKLAGDAGRSELALIASTLFDRSHPDVFGAALTFFKSVDGAAERVGAGEPWHADYRPVVSMLKTVNLQGSECEDLLVVSSHPAIPSRLFEDVGNCPQP